MDEQDKRLRQLIAKACQHPDGSLEWRRAVHQLLLILQGLPEFKHHSYRKICPDEDLFNDALNRMWEWFSQNIRDFEPRTPQTCNDLVRWIRTHLYFRIKDLELIISAATVVPAINQVRSVA